MASAALTCLVVLTHAPAAAQAGDAPLTAVELAELDAEPPPVHPRPRVGQRRPQRGAGPAGVMIVLGLAAAVAGGVTFGVMLPSSEPCMGLCVIDLRVVASVLSGIGALVGLGGVAVLIAGIAEAARRAGLALDARGVGVRF